MNLRRIASLIVLVMIIGAFTSWAQNEEEPCKLMLQNGLYKTFNFVKTSNFTQDLKTYFSSDQFKMDFKTNKWSGGISVIIDDIPLGLNAGASDTEIDQFQSRVRSATTLKVQQNFYDYALTTVPDVELAKEYTNCVVNSRKFGFKLYPTINDQDVSFVMSYTQQFNTDPMPKLIRLTVKNGSNVISSALVGQPISNNPVVTADRDPNKDLTFIFETDKGVVSYKVPSEAPGFNKDFPVGTIIVSYLNWTEFQNITQNNATNPAGQFWTSKYSKWAPADGRPVPNSKFLIAASQPNIPDLRGMFLRGLNSFDSDEVAAVDPTRKDPESRSRGSFQSDIFKKHAHGGRTGDDSPDHTHQFVGYPFSTAFGGKQPTQTLGIPYANFSANTGGASTRHQHNITAEGGDETRPKNVAIYYYIRIN